MEMSGVTEKYVVFHRVFLVRKLNAMQFMLILISNCLW